MTPMTGTFATDSVFASRERELLETLAELMIPAGDELPSAAEATIFAAVLGALSQRPDVVRAGLESLVGLAAGSAHSPFPALDTAEQLALVEALRARAPGFVALFESAVAACYYQDDRVLRSLGLPARAPFPEGNAVAPTDWSLLDPVRTRQPFYKRI